MNATHADNGAPSFDDLVGALADLAFDPSSINAQQRAAEVLARVPVEVEG